MLTANLSSAIDRWSVLLKDAELEQAYRGAHFERDRRRLRNLIWILGLMGGLSALTELSQHLHGVLDLSFVLPLRLVIFVCSIGFALAAGFSQAPRHLELVTVLYGAFSLVVNWLLLARHPALDLIGPTTMLGTVVIIYAFLPVRFALIVAIAVGSSVAMWVAWSFFRAEQPATHYIVKAGLWLLVINVLSLVNTRTLFRSERGLFAKSFLLERSLAQEREALEHQRQFVSMISHEFRNPLAIIKSQTQLGLDELEGQGAAAARLQAIERAALRMQGLFQQWLDSDRMLNSGFQPVLRVIGVADWLTAFVRQQGDETGARLQVQAPAAVLAPLRVRGDEAMLAVALGNLVDNACKYGGCDTPVLLTVRQRGRAVALEVTDQGSGIAARDLERIFEKYARVYHDRGVRGLGLGLYLVRRIMDMHGGRVEVRSEPGAGSSFTLWLPLV